MTSKSSLSDLALFGEFLKRRIWLLSASAGAFFFVLPIANLFRCNDYKEQLKSGPIPEGAFDTVFNGSGATLFITLVLAVIAGIFMFSFMHNRKQIDFYHSQPITRFTLFRVRYICGAAAVLIPYIIMTFIGVLIVAATGFGSYLSAKIIFGGIAVNIVFFLAVYTTFALAATLTGKIFTHFLLGSFILVFATICVGTYFVIMESFYDTFTPLIDGKTLLFKTSPLLMAINILSGYDGWDMGGNGILPGVMVYVELLIYSVVLFVLATLLYRKRPSESAGSPCAFRWFRPIIKYILVILATFYCGMLFNTMGNSNSIISGWFIFGAIIGWLFVGRLMEVIFEYDIKALKLHFKADAICLAAFAVLICIPTFDLTGYNNYVPKASNVKSASIVIPHLKVYGHEYNNDVKDNVILTGENINTIIKAAENCVNNSKGNSINNYGEGFTTVTVYYNLNSGNTKARTYNVPKTVVNEACQELVKSDEYRNKKVNRLLSEDYFFQYVECPGIYYNYYNVYPLDENTDAADLNKASSDQWKQEFAQKITKTLAADISNANPDDLIKEVPIATVNFGQYLDSNSYYRDYNDYAMSVPLYEFYDKTLALLEEYNIDIDELTLANNLTVDDIEKILVTESNYYDEEADDDQLIETKQNTVPKSEIAALLKKIKADYSLDNNFFYNVNYDKSYEIYLKDSLVTVDNEGDQEEYEDSEVKGGYMDKILTFSSYETIY